MTVDFQNTEIAFGSRSAWELARAYWLFRLLKAPRLVAVLTTVANVALKLRLPVGWAIKATVFAQFCGGETIRECKKTMARLRSRGVGTILDFAAEGADRESLLDANKREILRTVELSRGRDEVPFCVFKPTGVFRFALLEKPPEQWTPEEQEEWRRGEARVLTICAEAEKVAGRVLIDAEESWIQDNCDRLAERMMERFNRDKVVVFHTLQTYRVDRLEYLKEITQEARQKGYQLGWKVVRGAYLEKERERAQTRGYPSPIWETKEQTDRCFDEAVAYCLENRDHTHLVAGTHNEASCLKLVERMLALGLHPGDERIHFSQLLGMSDHISFNLSAAGYNVAKYVPYGPVRTMMPYLSRRAKENSSVTGQSSRELSLLERERERRQQKRISPELKRV